MFLMHIIIDLSCYLQCLICIIPFCIINLDAPMPSTSMYYIIPIPIESTRNNKIALDKLQFSNKLNARQNAGQSDDRKGACRRPVLLH